MATAQAPRLSSPPRFIARLAVLGMVSAICALGGLTLWTGGVSRKHAHGLSVAGVQTSGHLRALQAVGEIDGRADALAERALPAAQMAKFASGQIVLEESLHRMRTGGVASARRIAQETAADVHRLPSAIAALARAVRGGDPVLIEIEDDKTDAIVERLEDRFTDLRSDPSQLLRDELDEAQASERNVRHTAFIVVPVGLLFAGACAAMLGAYRRRYEGVLRAAVQTSDHEARTDQLTGLANRRALLEALDAQAATGESFVLAMADLNGFKNYNDTFGHAAGDAVLRRLGHGLEQLGAGAALSARLGGDEFCVIFSDTTSRSEARVAVREALAEEGEGFKISAACGVVRVPDDAVDASGALRLADARMYADKRGGRPSAEDVKARLLLRMLDERHPGLGEHVEDVAQLAVRCASELGLGAEEIDHVRHAAELHDIGKVAIPSSIVTKPGQLTDDEWRFMRQHTIIGERILSAEPGLEPVAAMVRASHERWDGAGYPDGLAGDAIPIGARVVAVADAFCAMTENRSYREPISVADALAELRACAGTQFDPAIVAAFLAAHQAGTAALVLAY